MRRLSAATLSVGLFITGLAPASAFSSIEPNIHDELTKASAKEVGLPGAALELLQQAVRNADSEEMRIEPRVDGRPKLDATDSYAHSHHCDRKPGQAHAQAFEATAAFVDAKRAEARRLLEGGDGKEAMEALGRALHAVQDCHSHSNAVGLAPDQQDRFQEALLENGTAPGGLKVTGFAPDADDPENPDDDPYPHGTKAIDSPGSTDFAAGRLPDGRTRYEAAREMAIETGGMFLKGFQSSVTAQEWALLANVEAPSGHEKGIPAGGLGIVALGAACAVAIYLARRRL